MIRSLHQPPDSASVSVRRSAGVGQDVSLLCLQCGPILLCVCGEVTLVSQRCSITPLIKKAYHLYFGCKLGDQGKKWAPHIVCKSCATRLGGWINPEGMAMSFAVPVVWRETSNHISDCYLYLTPPVASGTNRKRKKIIDYPNISSAIRPVLHGEDLPVLEPPKEYNLNSEMEEEDRRKQDLTKKNQQIQTSKVQHLSHLTHLHKTN